MCSPRPPAAGPWRNSCLELSRRRSLLLRGHLLVSFAADLGGGNQHIGGHARYIGTLRIVEAYLQNDGLDVTLAAAHVALCREIRLGCFEEHFPAGERAPGQLNA